MYIHRERKQLRTDQIWFPCGHLGAVSTKWLTASFSYHWCPASLPPSSSCKQSHWRWTLTGPPVASARPREASASPPWRSGGTKQKLLKPKVGKIGLLLKQCCYTLCPAGVTLRPCTHLVCLKQKRCLAINSCSVRLMRKLPFELRCELNSCTAWERGSLSLTHLIFNKMDQPHDYVIWMCDMYTFKITCSPYLLIIATIFPHVVVQNTSFPSLYVAVCCYFIHVGSLAAVSTDNAQNSFFCIGHKNELCGLCSVDDAGQVIKTAQWVGYLSVHVTYVYNCRFVCSKSVYTDKNYTATMPPSLFGREQMTMKICPIGNLQHANNIKQAEETLDGTACICQVHILKHCVTGRDSFQHINQIHLQNSLRICSKLTRPST